LDVVASLIVSPQVLFLDEPTTGLDPRSRAEIRSAVRALADDGTTILLSTQYLDEADQLSGQIVIIDREEPPPRAPPASSRTPSAAASTSPWPTRETCPPRPPSSSA
jgi:ABC-2 type transport system ATP-binding protein